LAQARSRSQPPRNRPSGHPDDGATKAILTPANYQTTGLVNGDSFTASGTAGA
jgi:hypothetical protein